MSGTIPKWYFGIYASGTVGDVVPLKKMVKNCMFVVESTNYDEIKQFHDFCVYAEATLKEKLKALSSKILPR